MRLSNRRLHVCYSFHYTTKNSSLCHFNIKFASLCANLHLNNNRPNESFVRVLRSIISTNNTDRHDITENIVKRDVEHHNLLTLTNEPFPDFTGLSNTTPSLYWHVSSALIWWGLSNGFKIPIVWNQNGRLWTGQSPLKCYMDRSEAEVHITF
jgi:hypothetical protein